MNYAPFETAYPTTFTSKTFVPDYNYNKTNHEICEPDCPIDVCGNTMNHMRTCLHCRTKLQQAISEELPNQQQQYNFLDRNDRNFWIWMSLAVLAVSIVLVIIIESVLRMSPVMSTAMGTPMGTQWPSARPAMSGTAMGSAMGGSARSPYL